MSSEKEVLLLILNLGDSNFILYFTLLHLLESLVDRSGESRHP